MKHGELTTSRDQLTLRIGGPLAALARIAAVTGNTLREAGRNRLFYGLIGTAVVLLIFSMVLSDLALVDQKARLVQDFGLFVIPLLCIVTAILLGVVLMYKEIDRKTLYAILPKPVRRSEFLLGKFAGLCILLLAQLVLLAVVWSGVLVLRGGEPTAAMVHALALQYIEIVLVTSIAMFFSALSSPVLSGVLTASVFLIGRITYVIAELLGAQKGVFAEVPLMRGLGRLLLAIVPDLSTFNVADELLLGWTVPWSYLASATAYGLSWSALFLVLALLLFERRDLV